MTNDSGSTSSSNTIIELSENNFERFISDNKIVLVDPPCEGIDKPLKSTGDDDLQATKGIP